MPLEPLGTDEKLDHAAPHKRDMDTLMLMGCGAFVVTSVGIYALTIWPFFFWPQVERLSTLGLCLAVGLIPSLVGVLVATRKAGLPGMCGGVAGAMTGAVFLYLRIQQAFLAAAARQDQPPDYPASLQTLVPLGWILCAALVGIVFLPKGELPSAEE